MIPPLAVLDGVVVAAGEARISAFDRAAWYGDAAFETFRTFSRRVHALDARFERLARSLDVLGVPARAALPGVRRDVAEAIASFPDDDAYVRVAVSRGVGGGGLHPSGAEVPTTMVVVARLPGLPERFVRDGLRVVTQASALSAHGTRGAGAKLSSYVEPLLAAREARASGADDAIGLDRDGVVLEATTSNVLALVDGRWTTPPTSLGVLPGITRATVMSLEDVASRVLTVRDLYRAQEIVLTSSIRGVVPVASLDGRPVGSGVPGPRTGALREAYRLRVESTASLVDVPPDSR